MLSQYAPSEVHLLILYFNLQEIYHLIMFCYKSSQNFDYLANFVTFLCDILKHNDLLHKSKSNTF